MFPKDIDWSVKPRPTTSMADKVIVALKVEKVISKNTLAWALNHIVRPGDCITLLAVFSSEKTGDSSSSSFDADFSYNFVFYL